MLSLVLLHAFPLSSAMWAAQRVAMSSTLRVITPDQRGFGGSPLPDEPPSLDRVADDLARQLDGLAIGRVVLGGLSMGGYVAMAFARRHPERLAGLALMGTRASADPEPVRANRLRLATAIEAVGSAEPLVTEVLPTLLGPTTTALRPAVAARVRTMVEAAPPGSAAWASRAMADRGDSFATLRTVRRPSLVLRGTEDELSTAQDAAAMAAALPDVEVVDVPRAGHLAAMEDPAAVTDALRSLLARIG